MILFVYKRQIFSVFFDLLNLIKGINFVACIILNIIFNGKLYELFECKKKLILLIPLFI